MSPVPAITRFETSEVPRLGNRQADLVAGRGEGLGDPGEAKVWAPVIGPAGPRGSGPGNC